MSFSQRPEKNLLVRCSFNRRTKKITFNSARNSTYESFLRADEDGEIVNISTEDELSDAIDFFNDGTDDAPLSSNISTYSGRSSSRRITMVVEVNIDYDGRLSDTASLDEYRDDSESQPSLSFGSATREFDDDDVTVSSRDFIAAAQLPNGRHAAEHDSRSLHLSSSSWLSVAREQVIEESEQEDPDDSASGTKQAGEAEPPSPEIEGDRFEVGNLEEEQEGDMLSVNLKQTTVNDRHAAWLREQMSLNNRANIGNISGKFKARQESPQVDSESISLEKGTSGRYYYSYMPASSHDQEHDLYREEFPPDGDESRPRPSSMQLAWLASQQRVVHDDYGSSSSFSLEEQSQGNQDYRMYLPQITTSAPPEIVANCSHCGVLLETIRYVCSTCGPKLPGSGSSSGSSTGSGPSSLTVHTYPPVPQQSFYLSPASSRTLVSSSESLTNTDRNRPLPPLPNNERRSTRPLAGYELCAECVQSYGVYHAIDPGLDPESSPLSSSSSSSSVQGWNRSAPRKGKLRHAFREQMWESNRWIDLQQGESTVRVCSMCGNETDKKRYKCAVCDRIHMCQSCYSRVHDLHPNHAFVVVPDVDVSMSFRVHPPQEEQPFLHRGVNCVHCRREIVGARFHCPYCGVDICQHCEAVGLPGNLDASDGGHDSTHIMLKIPFHLKDEEVNRLSTTARRLDRSDTATVGRAIHPSNNSHVDISASLASDHLDQLDHQIPCDHCRQIIRGIRYQCAICPSSPIGYSLCQDCEERSYEVHNPNHVFFRLHRPVDKLLESQTGFLPIMYTVAAGPAEHSVAGDPKGYLQALMHKSAVCDCCFEQIGGEWLRCVYCSRDLCHVCLQVDTHDDSHFFIVFKSKVNMQTFKQYLNVDPRDVRPPIIPYAVYRKLL